MKKLILSLAIVLSANTYAGVVATCKDSLFPAGENENGSMIWEKAQIQITVSEKAGKYAASIKMGDRTMKVTEGIEVQSFKGTEALGDMIEVLKMANLPYKKVASGTHYNFHPEANRDDASGISLTVVNDQNGVIVGKIFQAGWSVGVCK